MSKTTALCVLLFFSFLCLSSAADIDPTKTLVFGNGLTGVQAGYPGTFNIQPVDTNGNNITSCSTTFDVNFSPDVNTITHSCNSAGLYTWSYIAYTAMTYNLTIQYNGINLAHSPSSPVVSAAPIFPPKSRASGQGIETNTTLTVGNNYYFSIYAFDEYGNPNTSCHSQIWVVSLTGASPVPIPGTFINCSGNVFLFKYYVTISGRYAVSVLNTEGSLLHNSPFEVALGPGPLNGQYSLLTGSGSQATRAGVITYIFIQSKDQFGNTIADCPSQPNYSDWYAYLTYPGLPQQNVTISDCASGVYQGHYTVAKAGNWNLFLYYKSVKSSFTPMNISVTASPIISAQYCHAEGQGLYQATAGRPSTFSIIPEDRFGNRIFVCTDSINFDDWTINLVGLNDSTVTGSGEVVGCNNGVYTGQYSLTVSMFYSLTVFYNENPIQNNPNKPQVLPGSIDSTHTTISGNGLVSAQAGVPATFVLDAHDQYNNKITECIRPNPGFSISVTTVDGLINVTGSITSCNNGFYTGQYTLTETSNNYYLSITYSGNNIGQSPYPLYFSPGYPDMARCQAFGSGLVGTTAGQPATFTLQCHDAYNNPILLCYNDANFWEATLIGASKNYSINLINCDNSTNIANYTFSYAVNYAFSQYTIYILFTSNWTNAFVKTPVYVNPGPFDAQHSYAQGLGVTSQYIPAGSTASFEVIPSDYYGNRITNCPSNFGNLTGVLVQQQGPTNQTTITFGSCSVSSGSIPATYMTTKAASYYVHVYYQGQDISGSPYPVRVVGGAANPKSCVVSNFGHQSTAGQLSNFIISCSDQYGNPVYNCTSFSNWQFSGTGPSNIIASIIRCDNTQGYYYSYYSANKTGNYTLKISLNSVEIQGSPLTVAINPGNLADDHSFASGPGYQGAVISAGQQTSISIQAKDMYDNNIYQCTASPSYWNIILANNMSRPNQTFSSTSCTAGLYSAVFNATYAGKIVVNVRGCCNYVTNNPGSLTVNPGPYSPQLTIWLGYPSNFSAVIGYTFELNFITMDVYSNILQFCNSNFSNNLNISMASISNPNTQYFYNVSNCFSGVYTTYGQVFIAGNYNLVITLNGILIENIPAQWSFSYGYPVADQAYAVGTNTSVAGTDTVFYIQLRNQYGVVVNDNAFCVGPPSLSQNWDVSIIPAPAHNISIDNCVNGRLAVHYNSTKAGPNDIAIYFNGSPIILGSYHTTILPSILDPSSVHIENITKAPDTTGTFSLYANDIFGNPETVFTNSGFYVGLTPTCVNTSISCNSSGDHLLCTFTVEEGGQYCIRVAFQGKPIAIANDHIVVYGGSRCPGGCQGHGFCFVPPSAASNTTHNTTNNSTTNVTLPNGNCNCFPDYTGTNCNYTVSKRYMKLGLAIGLIVGLSILALIIGLLIGYFAIGRWRKMD